MMNGKGCNNCAFSKLQTGVQCTQSNCNILNGFKEWIQKRGPITTEPKSLDSGTRIHYATGAVREGRVDKGRYDLISPVGLRRLAKRYEFGSDKYGDRNWEKGLTISNCMDSLIRHINQYNDGDNTEDHLAAVAWNAFAMMHYEERNPESQDIPTRQQVATKEE